MLQQIQSMLPVYISIHWIVWVLQAVQEVYCVHGLWQYIKEKDMLEQYVMPLPQEIIIILKLIYSPLTLVILLEDFM